MNKKSILFGASLMSAAAAFAYVDITSDVTWTEMPDVGDGSGFYIFSPAGGSVTVNVDFESTSENPLPLFQIASDGWASQGRDVVNFNADSYVKTRLEVGNFNSADSSTGEMNVASGVSLAIEGFASVGSTNDSHSSDKRFAINLGKNSAMSTTSYFDVNKNGTLTIENGAKLNVGTTLALRTNGIINANGAEIYVQSLSTSEAGGFLNLNNSVMNITGGDFSNHANINVLSSSEFVFSGGRAFFNRADGSVKISSGNTLNVRRDNAETGNDSYFCNYGKLIIGASTSAELTDAALYVANFVDDGNAGIIALDFSSISESLNNITGIAVSASNGLSIDSTLFQYTLNGTDYKTFSLESEVKDGDLSLYAWVQDSSIFYTYSIPEPSTCAAFFGALALAFAAFRRKR